MADFFFNADSESWGADMIQGLIDGIKSMIGKVADAASEVAAKIASYLHFSAPDVGPLADYEKWMPDFMKGLSRGIDKNKDAVSDAITGVASDMVISPTMLLNQTLNGVAETSPAYAGTPQAMSFTSAGNSDTLDILSKYLPMIAENGGTNVSLEGDAAGIFNLVRKQNTVFARANGRSAFA
jgi:phage-related protein